MTNERDALESARFYLSSVEQTELFAQGLIEWLHPPMTITLTGDIGAGKTTMIRAMLRAMGVNSSIKSPTFSLVESYDLHTLQFHHFDLYRIVEESELEFLGFRDYFVANSICCIEWPERVLGLSAQADLALFFSYAGDGRVVNVVARDDLKRRIGERFINFTDVPWE